MHMHETRFDGKVWSRETLPAGSNVWVFKSNHVICNGRFTSHQMPSGITVRLITRGRGRVTVEGYSGPAVRGDLFSAIPGQLIAFEDSPDAPWEWLEFQLIGEGSMEVLAACGCTPEKPVSRAKNPDEAITAFGELHALFCREERRPHQVMALLHRIIDLCGKDPGLESFSGTSGNELLTGAQALIESQMNLRLNVNDIAGMLGVNRTTLGRVFKARLGITPVDYLQKRRLSRAQELLSTTALPIKIIASSVGYANEKYFTRCFREETGTPPGAWRRKLL